MSFFLFLFSCLRQHSYRVVDFLVVIPQKKNKNRIHSSVFGKFPIHQYYVYTTAHVFFFKFHMFIKEYIYIFSSQLRHVYASTVYISCLFGCILNPKSEFEFKMAVTVGLQDISSMYITLENPYVYTLHVYYLRIKLDWIFLA